MHCRLYPKRDSLSAYVNDSMLLVNVCDLAVWYCARNSQGQPFETSRCDEREREGGGACVCVPISAVV